MRHATTRQVVAGASSELRVHDSLLGLASKGKATASTSRPGSHCCSIEPAMHCCAAGCDINSGMHQVCISLRRGALHGV
jgi:hypothetical protein